MANKSKMVGKARAIRIAAAVGLLGLSLGLGPVAAVQAKAPVYRVFKDWVVACDNTGRCEASGASDAGTGWIELVRDAGADGAMSLTLYTPTAVPRSAWRVDQKPLPLPEAAWPAVSPESGEPGADGAVFAVRSEDPAAIQAVIDRIRQGQAVRFGRAGDARISLSGLSAALLLLDDTQGRLDTPTALLRRGQASAGEVPAAEPLPALPVAPHSGPRMDAAAQHRFAAQVRRYQSAALEAAECALPEGDTPQDEVGTIDSRQALVLLECNAGAYQNASLVFHVSLADPQQSERVMLPVPLGIAEIGDSRDRVISGAFADGLLHHYAKGRGVGDCGESGSWVWDGTQLQLVSFNYMDECRGVGVDWPPLWRSAKTP